MKPSAILLAVRMGIHALNEKHAALEILWCKFGHAIRHTRRERGISAKRLSRHLGVSPAMLGMLEKGKRTWSLKRAEKAAKFVSRPEQWPDSGRLRH